MRTDQHFERDDRGIACLPVKSRCSVRPCSAGSTPPTSCGPGTSFPNGKDRRGRTPLLMANSGVIFRHGAGDGSATLYLPKRPRHRGNSDGDGRRRQDRNGHQPWRSAQPASSSANRRSQVCATKRERRCCALRPTLPAPLQGHGGNVSDVDATGETGLLRITDMCRAPQVAKMAGLPAGPRS